MTSTSVKTVLLAGALALCLAPMASAKDKSGKKAAAPGAQDAAAAAWMKYTTPGEGHRAFDPFVGTWDVTMKWWMAPGTPPQESTGTAQFRWTLDGHYLQQDFQGMFMGKPFQGMEIGGYDNFRQQYESVWVDSQMTSIMMSTGSYDATAKSFTYAGRCDDLMTGRKDVGHRMVSRWIDNDHVAFDMYMEGPDGKEVKGGEMQYVRKI
jgi:hypothetical protein